MNFFFVASEQKKLSLKKNVPFTINDNFRWGAQGYWGSNSYHKIISNDQGLDAQLY